MDRLTGIGAGALGRIGRGSFIVILGPQAPVWDAARDPEEREKELREALGGGTASLSGLDLTDAYAAAHGREELVRLLSRDQPLRAGRVNDLVIALRPPWVFTTEMSGMVAMAARAVHLNVHIILLEVDSLMAAAPGEMSLVPLAGLLQTPDSLILTDADAARGKTREQRAVAFIKERVPNHELLFIGFTPADPFLRRILEETVDEMRYYGRKALVFGDGVSAVQAEQLGRRGATIVAASRDEAIAVLEGLPARIGEAMASRHDLAGLDKADLVQRLRRKIHDGTRKLLTAGISQPEHLEIGEPPDLKDIYVEPSLSTWGSSAESIDLELVSRLADEHVAKGKAVPAEIEALLGRRGPVPRRRPRGLLHDSERLLRGLEEIGYDAGQLKEPFEQGAVDDALRLYKSMVVIGDPACGKTQLLSALAHWITDPEDRRGLGLSHIVPLLVSVREYHAQRSGGLSLRQYLSAELADLAGEAPEAVQRLFIDGHVMLLLDGLDEVPSEEARRQVAGEIEELLTERAMRSIVTSRPVGYRTVRMTRHVPHLELDLLDDERVRQLLLNWQRRLEWLNRPELRADGSRLEMEAVRRADDLFGRLGMFEGLRELTRNPLMLTIAVFLDSVGQTLPERRADFYGRAADLLAVRWLRAKFQKGLELPRAETLMAALEVLGFHLQSASVENLVDGNALQELVWPVFARSQGYGEPRARREAGNLKELMRSLIGLVMERGTDRFGFTHLSFQEYFAARHLALGEGRQVAIEILSARLYESRWDQVTRMYLQLAPPDDARALFRALRNVPHPFDARFHPNPRRLAELLDEPNQLGFEAREEILQELLNLAEDPRCASMHDDLALRISRVPGRGRIGAEHLLLSEAGECLVRCAKKGTSSAQLAALKELGEIGVSGDRVTRVLLALIDQGDRDVREAAVDALVKLAPMESRVVRALLEVVRHGHPRHTGEHRDGLLKMAARGPTVTRELLLRMEKKTPEVRRDAVRTLVDLGLSGPEVGAALLARLQKDPDGDVIRAAVDGLMRRAASRHEVISVLLGRIVDKSWEVRHAAVDSLVELGASGAEVETALLARMKDKKPEVRQAALHGLVRLGVHRAVVTDALLASMKHRKWETRLSAVEDLVTSGVSSPEVTSALLLVVGDENEKVHEAAVQGLAGFGAFGEDVTTALLGRIERDPNERVLRSAVQGLLALAGSWPRTRDALLARTQIDSDPRIRLAAVECVLKQGASDPVVAKALLNRIETDPSDDVLLAAGQGLMEERPSRPELTRVLLRRIQSDPDSRIRLAVVEALAQLGASEPQVTALLLGLAQRDPDEDVRSRCVTALVGLGAPGPEVIWALLGRIEDEAEDVRRAAVVGLIKIGLGSPELLAGLLARTTDPRPLVRSAATKALAELGLSGPEVTRALLRRIEDESEEVRQTAIEGLLNLGEAGAELRDALLARIEMESDSNVFAAAVDGLVGLQMSSHQARDALLGRIDDEDMVLALAAITGLVELGAAGPEVMDAFLRLLERGYDFFVTRQAARGLRRCLTAETWQIIDSHLEKLDARTMDYVFENFDPLGLPWDFRAQGLQFRDGQWTLEQRPDASHDSAVSASRPQTARPDVAEVRRLAAITVPPATSELGRLTSFLIGQYPALPSIEKAAVRNLAGRWFAATGDQLVMAPPAERDARAADVASIARFVYDLCGLMRDEDDQFKTELFRLMWEPVLILRQAGGLNYGTVTVEVLKVLRFLHLYLPADDASAMESCLSDWRADPSLDAEHPLKTNPLITAILEVARRAHRD